MRTLFIVGSLLLATLSTAQAAMVNVGPSPTVVDPYVGFFSVLVSGTGFPETGGATLGLSFNPSVVWVHSVSLATNSPFDFISTSAVDNTTGTVQFLSLLAPPVGTLPSGSFNAFRIDFYTVGLGAANIALHEDGVLTGWSAADGSLIAGVTYNQANVTVSAVPLPAAIWLLFSGLGVLTSTRRYALRARG